ncbi:MAG: hypothetical protein ACTSV1_00965 [Alphaproteobacteria bacterium]
MPPWLHNYLMVPFKALAVLVGIYAANHRRVARLMAKPGVHKLWRAAVIVTALAWFVIWLIASDADRSLLTEAMKGLFSGFKE